MRLRSAHKTNGYDNKVLISVALITLKLVSRAPQTRNKNHIRVLHSFSETDINMLKSAFTIPREGTIYQLVLTSGH